MHMLSKVCGLSWPPVKQAGEGMGFDLSRDFVEKGPDPIRIGACHLEIRCRC